MSRRFANCYNFVNVIGFSLSHRDYILRLSLYLQLFVNVFICFKRIATLKQYLKEQKVDT
jgi:hypothetical protein